MQGEEEEDERERRKEKMMMMMMRRRSGEEIGDGSGGRVAMVEELTEGGRQSMALQMHVHCVAEIGMPFFRVLRKPSILTASRWNSRVSSSESPSFALRASLHNCFMCMYFCLACSRGMPNLAKRVSSFVVVRSFQISSFEAM